MEIWDYAFAQRAVIAGLAISWVAPMLGVMLLGRRMTLAVDCISHVGLAGAAAGLVLGLSPLLCVAATAIGAGIIITGLRQRGKMAGEVALGLVMPSGLAAALAIMAVGNLPASLVSGYLFGSIVSVSSQDLAAALVLATGMGALLIWKRRELMFLCIDEEAARLNCILAARWELLLMAAAGGLVAAGMKMVGSLLLAAVVTLPAITAARLAGSLKQTFWLAGGLGAGGTLAGLIAAFYLPVPAGPAVALAHAGLFAASLVYSRR